VAVGELLGASDPRSSNIFADHLSPVLAADDEMLRKVEHSSISLLDLIEGRVRAEQIERAFSSEGCGAVLIKLHGAHSALYERFYRLQWQLGTRAFDNDVEKATAAATFAALDSPVQQLLCRSGVGVARTRKGLTNPMPSVDLTQLLGTGGAPLTGAIGRPLDGNRQEFHPSVEWLLEQEEAGGLQRDENPSYRTVAYSGEQAESGIVGRARADEVQLLALYREWTSASPEERRGHGNKLNGDVYYGAFRGRTHFDQGHTLTVLFGPGELRDRHGFPVAATRESRQLGGTLMVASRGEETFTSLPYRLSCGSPYVVVFFEAYHEQWNPLGWEAAVHGVQRIEDTGFSRGQAVGHICIAESDFVDDDEPLVTASQERGAS